METNHIPNTKISLFVYSFIFFGWGLLTSLNGTLIGHLKTVFDLDEFRSNLINFMFFGTYFFIALIYYTISNSFDILINLGYKYLTVLGLCIAAFGALMFYPASLLLSFPMFIVALVILASGITILQLAANTYIIELSNDGLGASRLNLVQALNSLGQTLGPAVGGVLIFDSLNLNPDSLLLLGKNQIHSIKFIQAQSLQLPYWFLATSLFILAGIIFFLPMPDINRNKIIKKSNTELGSNIWLATIGIFVYVGAEVTIGVNLGNLIDKHYPSLIESKGFITTFYWALAMIGRFVGSLLLRMINSGVLLMYFAIAASLMVIIGIFGLGNFSIYALMIVGFFNSIMFPGIYANGIFELKEKTGKGASMLIMAIAGGAIIPLIYSLLSKAIGDHIPLIIAAICYGFIAYYGFFFSKLTQTIKK